MNHFILSDSRKCIGCQACEVACVMAHNEEQHVLTPQRFLPRITVIKAEGQRNAITCRHCEDAPCVRSCPNDAIAQSGDSVQVRQEKCIGCKSCMVACPFGVMQVVVTPQAAGLVKASAHKCDLCQGREAGPACVENCPAQALTLADDETLITLAKQRRLRSACQEVQPWQRATPLCSQPNAGAKVRQMAMTPPRGEPDKLAAEVRKSHFEEIYQPFTPEQAQQQAARCLTCGEHSICEWTCPLHNHIPQWIELVKAGNIAAAVALSHQTNCLPEITGRVCPQDRLCEGACTLRDESGAVTIGNIERYISDQALASGWRPDLSQVKPSGKRVAIIGAGPAGLACADMLVRHGVQPVVFDRHPEIGGLLTFGIPAFKLDKSLLARRRAIFSEMGIRFELNCEVGKDISMATLLADYDAVFVGAGTYRSMKAGLPNEEAPGVYDALPFLIANTKQVMGLAASAQEPYVNTAGLNVVVLGGGYTWNPEWAPSSNLINNSLPRLTEGIRLWQANPGSKMIFTGAAAKTNPVSTAEAGARVAESLGVPRSDIIVLDRPKDTEEEALVVKRAIGDAPFLLVTSASHLPRAMIFFRHAGLDPLPAPANQLAVTSPLNPWERAIPSPVWLMHSDRVGYETLGRVWQWLKGSSGEPGQE